MTRFFTYAAIVMMGASAPVAISDSNRNPSDSAEARLAADGAFRDGLYLGKLASEGDQPPSIAVGRWSTQRDREMFTAGYLRGYGNSELSGAGQ